jgi:hypothetical protein
MYSVKKFILIFTVKRDSVKHQKNSNEIQMKFKIIVII